MNGFLPLEQYKQMLDLMVIPCVDVIAKYKKQFVLIKRENEPAKGQWWLPGGRIFKGETIAEAGKRKLKEETKLTGTIVKTVGPYETQFKEAPFGIKSGVHSINVVLVMNIKDITSLSADKDHSAAQFFSKIEKSWHPYLKQVLKDAGFSE